MRYKPVTSQSLNVVLPTILRYEKLERREMSIEKAKELINEVGKNLFQLETIRLQVRDKSKLPMRIQSLRLSLDKALAELEAESQPDLGEFTKKMRMRILRDQPMVDAETASFDQLVVIATEALEHLEEACDLIDSLQEQLKEFKYWHDQLRNRYAALANKSVRRSEQLAAKDKALMKIQTWARAYPIDVFEKPNLKKAAEVLKANGMTLDAISADAMRHVLEGVKDIVEQSLKGPEREL